MLLCRHAGWGLQRRGVAAEKRAEHGRSASRVENLGPEVARRPGNSAPVTPDRLPPAAPLRQACVDLARSVAPGAKSRGRKTQRSGRRSQKTLTKFIGGPAIPRRCGRSGHYDGPGWSAGSWSVCQRWGLWRITTGFFVPLMMEVVWGTLPCEIGEFWLRPAFWSRWAYCYALGENPRRRSRQGNPAAPAQKEAIDGLCLPNLVP